MLHLIIFICLILFSFIIFFSIAAAEIFLGLAILFWLVRMAAEKRWTFKRTFLDWPLLAFFLAAVLCTITAVYPLKSLDGLRYFWLFAVFYVIVNNIENRREIQILLGSLFGGVFLLAALGIWQYFRMDLYDDFSFFIINCFQFFSGAQFTNTGRANLLDSMVFGGKLLVIIPLLSAFFLYGVKKIKYKLILFIIFLSGCLAVFLTFRMNVWWGLFAALFVIGIFGFFWNKKITVLCVILVVLVFTVFAEPMKKKAMFIFPAKKMSLNERVNLWKSAVKVMQSSPLVGVGIDNYQYAYTRYLNEKPALIYSHAHNNYLQIGAEMGIIGLGCFLWLIFVWLKEAYKGFKKLKNKNNFGSAICAGWLATVTGFTVAGFFEYNWGSSEVLLILLTIAGIFTCCLNEDPLGGKLQMEDTGDR